MTGIGADAVPRSVLLPRLDAIGDLVLVTGLLASLRDAWPGARFTFLVREAIVDLGALLPDGVETVGVPVEPARVRPNAGDARRLLDALGGRSWDLVVVTGFSSTWAEHVVAASQTAAARVSLSPWPGDDPDLEVVLGALGLPGSDPYDATVSVEERTRESDKYAALSRALAPGGRPPGRPRLTVPERARKVALEILAAQGLHPGRFVAVAPAGTQNVRVKAWPVGRFADVLGWLEATHSLPALLVGHVSEKEAVEETVQLARERGAAPRVFLGGSGDLPLLAGLLAGAALYFGNDTGPMHLAAALDVPVAAVFGGGTWPRFRPEATRSAASVGEMPCFGCGWDCAFEDAPCVRLVTVDDAKGAVASVLDPSGGRDALIPASTVLGADASSLVAAAARGYRAAARERRLHVRMIETLEAHLEESEADRRARLAAVTELGRRLEGERRARLAAVEELEQKLAQSESDRAARLGVIEELGRKLEESESDRAARLGVIEELGRKLEESESDRAARLEVIEELGRTLARCEGDRVAGLEAIEELRRQLADAEAVLAQLPVRVLRRLGIVGRRGRQAEGTG